MGGESDGSPVMQLRGGAVTRRSALVGAVAAGAALAPASAEASGGRLPVETAAMVGGRLLLPRPGIAAAEFFGEIVQDGTELTGYGYLTRVAGLADAAVFAGGNRSEAGARFTFSATATVGDRFVRDRLFSVTGTGALTIHLGPGDFGDPASFADGRAVATFAARFQNVLTVTAPNQAVTTIIGELRQRTAPRFTLVGAGHRLGRRGLRLTLMATGPGTRTDPAVPRAVFQVGGRLTHS
jgi:hypothetical protein